MRAVISFPIILMFSLVTIIPMQANAQTLMKLGRTCSYQTVYKFNDKLRPEYAKSMQCRRINKVKVVYA